MKITFSKNLSISDHLVFLVVDGKEVLKSDLIDEKVRNLLKNVCKSESFKRKSFFEFFHYEKSNKIKSISVVKINPSEKLFKLEVLSGKILMHLEKKKINDVSVLFEENGISNKRNFLYSICRGFVLKDYKFEKYRSVSKKEHNVKSIKLCNELSSADQKYVLSCANNSKGVFLTRDLVSEPANILYPEKFVDFCKVMKKAGVSLEIFDEKKLKKLKMNALLGVAQGSRRPARVLIMKWKGKDSPFNNPLAFVGKGVTFDTGGISLKPSGGMEDMKWDMGGAAVVAGLLYTLALRKAKANVVGIVGLVENMPDGNAQRPGDVVKSLSGQTIEVLNTDAEGRLVLADILWYINERFKPKFMIDLATLTGAIIVALGERYAGLFSNDDSLAKKILEASSETGELSWRLPMDEEFDKLLNCQIADMKNITGTRGAGSITAAQFLKRFVKNTPWAHLDIAGVTWSKKDSNFSRPGGTGFGVKLLDEFVKKNYG